jgi:hypothetical protein
MYIYKPPGAGPRRTPAINARSQARLATHGRCEKQRKCAAPTMGAHDAGAAAQYNIGRKQFFFERRTKKFLFRKRIGESQDKSVT